jgi:hypothetical protein
VSTAHDQRGRTRPRSRLTATFVDVVDVNAGGEGVPVPRYDLMRRDGRGRMFVAAVYARARDALAVVREDDIIVSTVVDEQGRRTVRQCWPQPFTGERRGVVA